MLIFVAFPLISHIFFFFLPQGVLYDLDKVGSLNTLMPLNLSKVTCVNLSEKFEVRNMQQEK